jgi:hypothetical protein
MISFVLGALDFIAQTIRHLKRGVIPAAVPAISAADAPLVGSQW